MKTAFPQKEQLKDIEYLKRYGKNSLSFLTLSEELFHYVGSFDGYVAHTDFLKVATVLGDPVVSDSSLKRAVKDFKVYFSSKKYHICIFACTDNVAKSFEEEGFSRFYIGSEAIVRLDEFSLSGNNMQSVRGSVNYAIRNEMKIEEYCPEKGRNEKIEKEILEVSNEWCSMQRTPPLSFMVGKLDFETWHGQRYFMCRQNDKIVSFITYYPILATGDYYLDHTRRRIRAPRGSIDYLVTKSFNVLKNENVNRVYMGLAPFSLLDSDKNFNPWYINALFLAVLPFSDFVYPARSEFFFKNKFATYWEPQYMCCYPRLSLRILLSILEAFCPGGFARLLSYKAKRFIKGHPHRNLSPF